jgi:tricorn protease
LDEPLPQKLAVPYGTNGAINGDGTFLAYTPHSHDYRTWKRYRGGMASDIWLLNLKSNESKQITDFEGTDSLPMWHGSTVYYITDAGPEHRLNIWAYDTKTTERRQLTTFKDDDCKFPAIGPGVDGKGEIIVQNGTGLHLVNIENGSTR